MRRRIAEVSSALDLVAELERNVNNLSGGTKQKVVLASVLALQPEILLLDEPISQLDPIGCAGNIEYNLGILMKDLGITVVIAEHRIDSFLSWADRVIAMDKGRVLFNGSPREYAGWANSNDYGLIPSLSRLFAEAEFTNIPLNVKEARREIKPLDLKLEEGNNTSLLLLQMNPS